MVGPDVQDLAEMINAHPEGWVKEMGLHLSKATAEHPQLTLIIDHMGVSTATLRAGKMPEAVAQAATLAKHPNVSVKLSSSDITDSSKLQVDTSALDSKVKKLQNLSSSNIASARVR